MRTIVHFTSMLLLATLALAQDGNPPAQPASVPATVAGEYILNLNFDPKVPRPDLAHLILSQEETVNSARKILNLQRLPHVGLSQTERGAVSLRFNLDLQANPDARPAVREFVDAIVKALPQQLRDYQEKFVREERERARQRLREAEVRLQEERAQSNEQRDKLRAITGRIDAVENWSEAIAAMEQERHKLALDLAGQRARRQAIEETIAKIAMQAEARVKEDEIAEQLAKIVTAREEERAHARQLASTGRLSAADLSNIEAKIADAKARLLERREMAARAAGGEMLAELNRELLMLSINRAEHEARLKAIQESLERFHAASDEVDALKKAEKDLHMLEARYEEAMQRAFETEERYQNLRPPTVSVVDSDFTTLQQRPQ